MKTKKIFDVMGNEIKYSNSYNYEIKRNELSNLRVIGLTIETKPDWCLEPHINEALDYGCTRFEIGVQTLNENCLKKTNRGHTLEETKKSFQVAKDMCFKINAHMMLGLPASNLEIDEKGLNDIFLKEDYRPDMIKIYPCLVNIGTPLYKMYELGLFKPIDTKKAAEIIGRCYKNFPRYTRVMRVQRDIPTDVIISGVQNSNLRQFVDDEMKKNNVKSKDIRAREIGLNKVYDDNFFIKTQKYNASKGVEYFLDASNNEDILVGFIRLRLPFQTGLRKEIDSKTALIRELHIYGQTIPVGQTSLKSQHKGWGSKLVFECEKIAKENGYKKIAIISGVGVREYYKKLGYVLKGSYMIKKL